MRSNRWELLDRKGETVGQLAGSFTMPIDTPCVFGTVLAVSTCDRDSSEPQYREGLLCDAWEVVVPELVFDGGSNRVEDTSP